MSQRWYKNGKRNECERYQRYWLSLITGHECRTTQTRINIETNRLLEKTTPLRGDDGFEWTENFDGVFNHHDTVYYVNFKFVCGLGGAQTRTLREVYWFIKSQIGVLPYVNNVKFINILDGNAAHRAMGKFRHLNPPTERIYIGDLSGFSSWWNNECEHKPLRKGRGSLPGSRLCTILNHLRILVNLVVPAI